MNDNVRRPSGLTVNGIPSADDIIAMARDNVFLAGAISQWKHGTINFDEALRLAIRLLLEQNEALNRLSQAMAASAWPGPIIIEHPIRGSDEPLETLAVGKVEIGGKAVIADGVTLPTPTDGRIPFYDQAGREIGWMDGVARIEDGRTICDLHLHPGEDLSSINLWPGSATDVREVSPGDLLGDEPAE